MSRLRKTAIALGAAVVLTAAALAAWVATFDPNAYKGLAIDWMQRERQRTLTIDGPVSLSVFPRLALRLQDVTLSERGRRDEFAHLGDVALSVAVLPLLSRRVEVDGVQATGVRAVWRRTADGASNIDDLLSPGPQDPAPDTGDAAGERLGVDISGIRLQDVQLAVDDAVSGTRGQVSVARLVTGRMADGVEAPVEVDARLALVAPAVSGQLSGKTQLTLGLAAGSTRLRDMALRWQGEAAGLRAMDVTLAGALARDARAGTLSASDLAVTVAATAGALRLEDTRLTVKAFAFDPATQRLALEALQLRVAGRQDGHPLRLDLDWPRLAVEGRTLSGGPLSGAAKFEGPLALDATFRSAAPRGGFDRLDVPALETTFQGAHGKRRLSGTVRADLALDPRARSVAIAPLAATLAITEPSLQPVALKAAGRLTASATAATWALTGDINGNRFETQGRAGLADRPVSVDASATFAALDLNRILPPPAAKSAPAPASGPTGPQGTGDAAPVDLSVLQAFQGRLVLRAGRFGLRQYHATDLALEAALRGGTLRVAPFSAGLWGGRVTGTAEAAAGTGRVAARGTADGIDVQALLHDVAGKDLLEGRGRLAFDLAASGRTVGALQSSLGGTAALQLRDGAVRGVNLAQRLRQAKAALSMKADAAVRASSTEKTDFSELSASFAIAEGIARNRDLDLKSPFLRLGGEGLVDIPQARIDYTVRATAAGTSKGQGGADLAELRGVTVPVRLTGPLDAVQWQVRWSEVAADVLKSEVGRQVEQRLKDKLGEQLGLPPAGAASAPAGAASRPEDVLKDRLRRLIR